MFKTTIRRVDRVVVVDCEGRLTIGEPVLVLRETIREQINEGRKKIVVNLADVSYVDASGIGELVGSYTTLRNKSGDLKLLSVSAKLKDFLRITKMLTVFDTFESEEKALESLR